MTCLKWGSGNLNPPPLITLHNPGCQKCAYFYQGTRPVQTSQCYAWIAGYSPKFKVKELSFPRGFPNDLFGNDLKSACW